VFVRVRERGSLGLPEGAYVTGVVAEPAQLVIGPLVFGTSWCGTAGIEATPTATGCGTSRAGTTA
jgi:hypothetical protein